MARLKDDVATSKKAVEILMCILTSKFDIAESVSSIVSAPLVVNDDICFSIDKVAICGLINCDNVILESVRSLFISFIQKRHMKRSLFLPEAL